jgi:FG-GAP-like repeat
MTLPNITIAPGINAIEGGLLGEFIITLDAPAPVGGLIVKFAVSGSSTATATTDYTFGAGSNITSLTTNTFTIAAGATTAVIRVTAPIDGVFDPNETIIFNLTDSVKFLPVRTFNTGTKPTSVAVGDINGDGKSDLVVGNLQGVSVLIGNGIGGFSTPTTPFGVGGLGASSLTLGDFNGDGKTDIATTNSDRNSNASVLIGNGIGGFSSDPVLDVGAWSLSITTGDFHNDGKLDLVLVNTDDNNFSILKGNGNGTFANRVDLSSVVSSPVPNNTLPISVRVGDFNGDNKLDLAIANINRHNFSTVSILIGNGSGGFNVSTTVATKGAEARSLAIGDFNGDGKSDLAVASLDHNNVSILLGNGSGDRVQIEKAGNKQAR